MTKRRASESNLSAHDEDVRGRHQHHDAEEPPPFGGSWRNLYAAVLINLAALVLLFHLFTRVFG
jgi:hypothetical protein